VVMTSFSARSKIASSCTNRWIAGKSYVSTALIFIGIAVDMKKNIILSLWVLSRIYYGKYSLKLLFKYIKCEYTFVCLR